MVKIHVRTQMLNGHRVGRVVNKQSLDSAATVAEAIKFGFVVGKDTSILGSTSAVLHSMVDGIQRDGNGRKIDGYLSLNAYPQGKIKDITDEYTAKKVAVRAKMLKEFQDKVDTSNFSIIIEGASGMFLLETITTGEKSGEIVLGKNVALNGTNLTLGEGDKVEWSVPETGAHGQVAASYLTSDDTRITIARDGLQELFNPDNNGKDIVFVVKIGKDIARNSALMIYAA